MLPNHELTIIVAGKAYGGWLEVSVERSIEHAAGAFEISATQRWPGDDGPWKIAEGAACEIRIGNDKVLTGYVDAVEIERSASDAKVALKGRSKTGDLIDCSPELETLELAGLDIAAVARKVCQPFGIDVVCDSPGPVYPVAAAHHGESAWKLIERLARQRKLLVMDDEEGRLVLAQLATKRATDSLIHPADGLKQISAKRDSSKRFSDYIVKAQAGGGARWVESGQGGVGLAAIPSAVAHVEGRVKDTGVTRYRPKIILNEAAAKKQGAMARAEWEARRNIGKALTVEAQRLGWRQSDDSLWRPNLLVPVKAAQLNVDAQLALGHVKYIKSAAGTICHLKLAPPEAFTDQPPEAPGVAGDAGSAHWAGAANIHASPSGAASE